MCVCLHLTPCALGERTSKQKKEGEKEEGEGEEGGREEGIEWASGLLCHFLALHNVVTFNATCHRSDHVIEYHARDTYTNRDPCVTHLTKNHIIHIESDNVNTYWPTRVGRGYFISAYTFHCLSTFPFV